ncbi:DUF4190 domain-containing protein [Streptomyces sp. ICC1]|uniref:DUF4190 domain-containing protein n=1 Tax=Streptomyces sp. ICC1 TaxID=2099583 RepID=UPI000DC77C89|nr:DUF4190 domain-containing protein [Streptomyces sp. ICC1]AWZ11674.1 hypothetical protein DRB96_04375 [Streptomyces sp. ICC1]
MSSQPPHQWPAPPPSPTPPPYGGPYAGPYGPADRQPPALNGFALASLLVGLLCFPPLGIVFAVVALVQIAKKGERGKALAVVGLVVSVVMSAAVVLAVPVVERAADELGERARAARPSGDVAGVLTDAAELRVGHCFNVPGGDLYAAAPLVYRIDCAEIHDAEVTSATSLGGRRFPGAEELRDTAARDCLSAQDAYAMDTWALPAYAESFYFAPTRGSWSDGDRRIVCVIGTAEQDHRGSLRKDAGTLTPDQVAFLRTMNGVDAVLSRAPEGDVDDELPAYRDWAREVDLALGDEARLLDGAKARPELSGPAGVQRERLDVARREWQRAALAKTPDGFLDAWDRAAAALPVEVEKVLRGAYGLSTTVPPWLEEPAGDGPGAPGTPPGPGRSPSVESA